MTRRSEIELCERSYGNGVYEPALIALEIKEEDLLIKSRVEETMVRLLLILSALQLPTRALTIVPYSFLILIQDETTLI